MPSLSELGYGFLRNIRAAMTNAGGDTHVAAEFDEYGNPVMNAQTLDIAARIHVVTPDGQFDPDLHIQAQGTLVSGDQQVVLKMDTSK